MSPAVTKNVRHVWSSSRCWPGWIGRSDRPHYWIKHASEGPPPGPRLPSTTSPEQSGAESAWKFAQPLCGVKSQARTAWNHSKRETEGSRRRRRPDLSGTGCFLGRNTKQRPLSSQNNVLLLEDDARRLKGGNGQLEAMLATQENVAKKQSASLKKTSKNC